MVASQFKQKYIVQSERILFSELLLELSLAQKNQRS